MLAIFRAVDYRTSARRRPHDASGLRVCDYSGPRSVLLRIPGNDAACAGDLRAAFARALRSLFADGICGQSFGMLPALLGAGFVVGFRSFLRVVFAETGVITGRADIAIALRGSLWNVSLFAAPWVYVCTAIVPESSRTEAPPEIFPRTPFAHSPRHGVWVRMAWSVTCDGLQTVRLL